MLGFKFMYVDKRVLGCQTWMLMLPIQNWCAYFAIWLTSQWRHNARDSVSNHQPCEYSLNRLIRCRSKKTSKLRVTGLCEGNSLETGEFPAQRASNAENISIWWRHHGNGPDFGICITRSCFGVLINVNTLKANSVSFFAFSGVWCC